jgi:hypothetical protein
MGVEMQLKHNAPLLSGASVACLKFVCLDQLYVGRL